MSELRQDSLHQTKSLRWITILVAAILIVVGVHSYVLIRRDFKEQSLSTELKEMRRMVEELSSKVAKTEAENENLREEVSNTEISRLRRSNPCHTGHGKHKNRSHCCHSFEHCMKRHNTAKQGLDCPSVRKCQPQGSQVLFQWRSYDPLQPNKIKSRRGKELLFTLGGWYSVYLNLRVSEKITVVKVVNVSAPGLPALMSFTPIPSNDSRDIYFGTVHISRLLKIPENTKLSVQVVFKPAANVQVVPGELFPNYSSGSRNTEDNFGAFLVS